MSGELERKEAQPPHVIKESSNIDVSSDQCKRMRVTSSYLQELAIDSVRSDQGLYEGDTVYQQEENKQRRKIKEGKGAMLF